MWFAMIMNRDFKGRGLVRAAILIPWAIPTAVTAKLWFFIFAFDGIANKLLGTRHHSLWTGDPWAARFAIIIADVWKTTPFMALLILAGLQLIPADVYEAAQIDGATEWQTLHADHAAAGQGGAHGRGAVPHPRRAAHLRPAGHPHRGGGGTGTRRPRCRSWSSTRSGRASTAPSALSTIIFLFISFVAFIFIKFLGADVVQRPTEAQQKAAEADDGHPSTAERSRPRA